MSLRVSEIFLSIQGESSHAGLPCAFVRLAGCNLDCRYCDTPYARGGGEELELEEVVGRVEEFGVRLVEITGGEPLFQEEMPELARRLCEAGHIVLVETNGSMDITVLDPRVIRIMDLKCPSSGESGKMRWGNIGLLKPRDEVKFVIGSRNDYEWAIDSIRRHALERRCHVLLGTVFGVIEPKEVVEWMLRDRLEVRFQLQLHKYVWPHGRS